MKEFKNEKSFPDPKTPADLVKSPDFLKSLSRNDEESWEALEDYITDKSKTPPSASILFGLLKNLSPEQQAKIWQLVAESTIPGDLFPKLVILFHKRGGDLNSIVVDGMPLSFFVVTCSNIGRPLRNKILRGALDRKRIKNFTCILEKVDLKVQHNGENIVDCILKYGIFTDVEKRHISGYCSGPQGHYSYERDVDFRGYDESIGALEMLRLVAEHGGESLFHERPLITIDLLQRLQQHQYRNKFYRLIKFLYEKNPITDDLSSAPRDIRYQMEYLNGLMNPPAPAPEVPRRSGAPEVPGSPSVSESSVDTISGNHSSVQQSSLETSSSSSSSTAIAGGSKRKREEPAPKAPEESGEPLLKVPRTEIKEALSCRVCLDLISERICSCNNGHLVCHSCFQQLPWRKNGKHKSCPTCREEMDDRKPRLVTQLRDLFLQQQQSTTGECLDTIGTGASSDKPPKVYSDGAYFNPIVID